MALSKSLQKGQAPLVCQMCEDTTEIKWKCLTCQLFMCTKCRKIHQKVKSSNEHNIIDIKDISLYSTLGSKPDFTNIRCTIHQGQSLCVFCADCYQGICPTCITKTHSKHTMIELSDGYKLSIEKIKKEHGRIDERTLRLVEDLSSLTLIKSKEKTKNEKQKQEILKQESVLTDAIKKYTQKLLNEVDEKWLYLNTSIGNEENKVSKILRDLDSKKNILSNAVNSNNAGEIFRIVQHELCSVPGDPPSVNSNFKQLSVFVPGCFKGTSIKSVFGSLEDNVPPLKIELKVVQKFKTDRPCLYNITCCNDGSLWINDFGNKKLQQVTLSDRSIQINRTIGQEVSSTAVTNSGHLLISIRNPKLQVIPYSTGKPQKSKYSVAPLITTGVHVTRDNKILVGARESGNAFSSDGKYGPRKLIVMNDKGEHETVHQYDNSQNALFRNIFRITTGTDNIIYVIDMLSEDGRGRVVVLEWCGDVRGIYEGHPEVNNKDHPFTPFDIKSTESTTTIVIEEDNNLLHLLDNNGLCIKYFNTKDLGFELPRSLDIDNNGHVYIGCDTYKNQPDEAELIELQFK